MVLIIPAVLSPSMPAVTAMALVALGATDVTLTRFRAAPGLLPIMLLHATIYGGLYAIFVGAALHAASAEISDLPTLVDLAASTLPAAATARQILAGLRSTLAA
jgi:hypothetical protein